MASAGPALSVLTPSRNRHDLLLRKAGALAAQTLAASRFEWLIWLNEDEASRESLEARLVENELPFGWRLLGGSERPVGEARNLAAEQAQGGVLLLSDDDCLPVRECLQAHLDFHLENDKAVGIGPLALPEELRVSDRREPFERTARLGRRAFWFNMTGANSSVPTRLFREVGGYDALITGYGGEDTELALRLRRRGVRFFHVPGALAHHHGRVLDDTGKAYSAGKAHRLLYGRFRTGGWALGVHPVQLALKRAVFYGPWSRLIERGTLEYERAYLKGALEGKDV